MTNLVHLVHQAPLSMGFSRQEYWSGLPFPSPGDLPDPGIELGFKEVNPEYSLEGLMLKLKLQYFDHLMRRADSLVKTSDAGKD